MAEAKPNPAPNAQASELTQTQRIRLESLKLAHRPDKDAAAVIARAAAYESYLQDGAAP